MVVNDVDDVVVDDVDVINDDVDDVNNNSILMFTVMLMSRSVPVSRCQC